jgi:hypothetical protein
LLPAVRAVRITRAVATCRRTWCFTPCRLPPAQVRVNRYREINAGAEECSLSRPWDVCERQDSRHPSAHAAGRSSLLLSEGGRTWSRL